MSLIDCHVVPEQLNGTSAVHPFTPLCEGYYIVDNITCYLSLRSKVIWELRIPNCLLTELVKGT